MKSLDALAQPNDAGWRLEAPEVGYWRDGPPVGRILRSGDPLGVIVSLGRSVALTVPASASGRVVTRLEPGRAEVAVGYGASLLTLDPTALGEEAANTDAAEDALDGLGVPASVGGRIYHAPGPGKPAFVKEGDIISEGQVVALIEVMKTFNRVSYGGPGLPPKARVLGYAVPDGADVEGGAIILRVEPVS